MTKTTNDCRAFIVDFQRRNPQIEEARFGADEIDAEARAALTNPTNWRRQSKCRPSADTDFRDAKSSYGVYVDGQPVNRHADHQSRIAASEVAWERRFDCKPFDGQVTYLVLETHDGRLLFSEHVGD